MKARTHRSNSNCKPKPEMIKDLIDYLDVDVKASYMIGDREVNLQAGLADGFDRLMVSDHSELALNSFENLASVANWILGQDD